MRRLIVLRHAQADWPEGVDDADRPLTTTGQKQAARVGHQLREAGAVPERVLVSPALRTTQTWEFAAPGLGSEPESVFVDSIYSGSSRALLQVIREHGDDAATLLVIGHNPGVHDLVAALARDAAGVPTDYPPATAAILEFDFGGWADLSVGDATVVSVLRP